MRHDRLITNRDVGGVQDRADLLEWHVEVAEPADDLRDRNLSGRIKAVAAGTVHLRRAQEADVVVVTKRLHAQMRHPGELTDGQQHAHVMSVHPPPTGESSPGPCGMRLRCAWHPGAMTVSIASITFDSTDPEPLARWWAERFDADHHGQHGRVLPHRGRRQPPDPACLPTGRRSDARARTKFTSTSTPTVISTRRWRAGPKPARRASANGTPATFLGSR